MRLLLSVALLVALLWLVLFRWLTPRTWTTVWRRALGQLLEILLYGDRPRVLWQTLGDLVNTNLRLSALLLAPSLASLALLGAGYLFLHDHYQWRPPQPGERFLVSAPAGPTTALSLPDGLNLDGEALWSERTQTSYWPVVAQAEGCFPLQLSGQSTPAQVWIGSGTPRLQCHQGKLHIYYPPRLLWCLDTLLPWPVAFGAACLFWLLLLAPVNLLATAWLRQVGFRLTRNN